jgi:hypothetical protein
MYKQIRNVCIYRYSRTSFQESHTSNHMFCRDDYDFGAVDDKVPMQDIIPNKGS